MPKVIEIRVVDKPPVEISPEELKHMLRNPPDPEPEEEVDWLAAARRLNISKAKAKRYGLIRKS